MSKPTLVLTSCYLLGVATFAASYALYRLHLG